MEIRVKEKLSSFVSIFSSVLSFLGGYQICHNICLGIIAILALLGITVVGFPLLFLTKIAIPFWIVAVVLLIITLVFYFKKRCISRNMILLNSGIIIAGVPFKDLESYNLLFWVIGGALVLLSLILIIRNRFKRDKEAQK